MGQSRVGGTREGETGADGRHARAERNRDAVVEAILDLLREGVPRPTAEAIAERSGLSVRSVFRHFDDLESLYAAAVDRHSELIASLFEPPPSGGSRAQRVDELAARRARLFEEMAPIRRVGERLRGESQVIESRLRLAREVLRSQVEELFAPELQPLAANERRDLLDTLEVVSSWATWDVLRREERCSVTRARGIVARLLHATLAEA